MRPTWLAPRPKPQELKGARVGGQVWYEDPALSPALLGLQFLWL